MAGNGQTVSVELPEAIFRRLRHIAEVTHRSVEDVLATTVNAALPQTPGVPADVADDLAALSLFSDAALWTAAQASLSLGQQRRLNQLAEEGETRSLSEAEAAELAQLIDTYDRVVLRRAKAMALLAQRGYDVSSHAGIASHLDGGS
jgi:hypothetical protein